MKKELYQVIGYAHELLKLNPIDPIVLQAIKKTDSLIFGGYVRDLIAKKFNPNFKTGFKDVDIVCLPNARNKIYKHLQENGYHLSNSHEDERYTHWGSVSSIYTLEKQGFPNVQLVGVAPKTSDLKKELLTPIIAVDLRCCAVAITSNMKLIKTQEKAIEDCKKMKLVESKYSSHKTNLKERIGKLKKRGWSQ